MLHRLPAKLRVEPFSGFRMKPYCLNAQAPGLGFNCADKLGRDPETPAIRRDKDPG